ncbi:MAG: hypothetical protein MUF15_23010 [Acidobacteria bacterium]|jgi:hypothetical protein|nr:hypothetical protein [Acidobacteriota bacterium]
MQISEPPLNSEDLDLFKQLKEYADGKKNWIYNEMLENSLKGACNSLHSHLLDLVRKVLSPLLDQINKHEMEYFTSHDRKHGMKVAHLMWNILTPERRSLLSPPEIGLLVSSAFFHDIIMALSPKERVDRLLPGSDLWNLIEEDEFNLSDFIELNNRMNNTSEKDRMLARRELEQVEEGLLCLDTRRRHATEERYLQFCDELIKNHNNAPEQIPDIRSCFSFNGDSFLKPLIKICVSHNEEADSLTSYDCKETRRRRFTFDFPIGGSTADLHLVAATLRLADILDFDRERTPAMVFHFLMPGRLKFQDDRSLLEWGKHMAISSWEISDKSIVYRGRSESHIIHHAVVEFCQMIEDEIQKTKETFLYNENSKTWPIKLPESVKVDIHSEGYSYLFPISFPVR